MFVTNRRTYTLGDVNLGGAGSRVYLVIDDTRYRPEHVRGSDLTRELTVDGSEVFQRANHIAFPRTAGGRAILTGAEDLRLLLLPTGLAGVSRWFRGVTAPARRKFL